MRIGVVCEGQTDFIALESFLIPALANEGVAAQLVDLQPRMDLTRQGAGWSNALTWLITNNLASRQLNYLGTGLFSGIASPKNCDVILTIIDADVLDFPDFSGFLKNKGYAPVNSPQDSEARYTLIQSTLATVCGFATVAEAALGKHVVAAAVENSEAWCTASYVEDGIVADPEKLPKAAIAAAFANKLVHFDGQGADESIKDVTRRRDFCRSPQASWERVCRSCPMFQKLRDEVVAALAVT